MAEEKLDNVTHLPARKAKGAGGTGKAKIDKEATLIGDNSDEAGRAREAAFLVHMQSLTQHRARVDEAKDALKAIKKLETLARNAAKADGFRLHLIDEIMEDEGKTRADLTEYEEERRWMRNVRGLPVGYQADLFADTPQEAKDELDWNADGYRCGVRGHEAKPPAEIPPRFVQHWMQGWNAGQEKLAWALAENGKNPERKPGSAGFGPTADEIKRQPEPESEGEFV